jgi:hypothetical protein
MKAYQWAQVYLHSCLTSAWNSIISFPFPATLLLETESQVPQDCWQDVPSCHSSTCSEPPSFFLWDILALYIFLSLAKYLSLKTVTYFFINLQIQSPYPCQIPSISQLTVSLYRLNYLIYFATVTEKCYLSVTSLCFSVTKYTTTAKHNSLMSL